MSARRILGLVLREAARRDGGSAATERRPSGLERLSARPEGIRRHADGLGSRRAGAPEGGGRDEIRAAAPPRAAAVAPRDGEIAGSPHARRSP